MRNLNAWWRSFRRRLRQRWVQAKAPGRFLCDTCRYDYGEACRHKDRPNAAQCPDYKPR